jgi:NADH dehydrogenase (ubiquinone) 1 alpha subcomplex subunit 9
MLLGKMGTQVIVPYREEDEARIFKPMGDLGQIVRMVSSSRALLKSIFLFKSFWKKEWDLRNENSIAECLRHSDIVFNLTGRDFATKYARFSHLLSFLTQAMVVST